jgi:diaminopimelate epimerase
MKFQFTKMHGLGNDFVILDNRNSRIRNLKKLAVKLCERRFGVGADQLLVLRNSRKADFRMQIINSDGSEVEMCGNGIRCLAKYIWDNNIKSQSPQATRRGGKLTIETLAGIICPEKSGSQIKVDMGEPLIEGKDIPVRIDGIVINHPLIVKGATFRITCVSMGNPHTVILTGNTDRAPVDTIGPVIERHRLFPHRTNVEFIQILNRKNIRMRVWERGAGETLACGTGASAAAVASSLLGLTDRKVSIHLKGGKLQIHWSKKDNRVYMTGPAVKVYEGFIEV